MTERAYADVVGNFRRGMAGAYARRGDYDGAAGVVSDQPELAQSYAAMGDRATARDDRRTAEANNQAYAGALATNNFDDAATIAAKAGNPQGVSGARAAGLQLDAQQRQQAYQQMSQGISEIEGLTADTYPAWRTRAIEAMGRNPAFRSVLNESQLPPQWSPGLAQALQTQVVPRLTALRDSLLTPEQSVAAEDRRADNIRGERQLEISSRMADASERRAAAAEERADAYMANNGGGGSGLTTQQFNRANALRDEYNRQTQDYRGIANIVARSEHYATEVQSGRAQPNSQSDIGLVYALAKVYDPTSVVREGEFATVARSGGFGPQVQAYVNRIVSGGQLPPEIRNGIMNSLRQTYTSQRQQYEQVRSRYEGLAQHSGIDPSFVIDDYTASPATPPPGPPAAPGATPQRPPGVPATAHWDARARQWVE